MSDRKLMLPEWFLGPMVMSESTAALWHHLAAQVPAGKELRARLFLPQSSKSVFIAVDSRKRRHILIKLQNDEDTYFERPSRGLEIITEEYLLTQESPAEYIDVICLDSAGNEAFDLIAQDLASEVGNSELPRADAVRKVIGKWRRFWGRPPSEVLSSESQLGLFAELWFLNNWLIPSCGPLKSVECWRGPNGNRHDFEKQHTSFEVKATASQTGIFQINGIDQLSPPQEGDLFLFGLRVKREVGALANLPVLIAECMQKLQVDASACDLFEAALFQAGYSPEHEEEYRKNKYRICDESLYKVRDDFPRLAPEMFSDGVPNGVAAITYGIVLNGFDHLVVAETPEQFAQLDFFNE